jgi:AraC-like DNA-binding protein
MPVVTFDMSTANHQYRRFEFRGKNKSEYYEGDLIPLTQREVEMKIEKSLAGDFAIYKLTSRAPLAFRRSWMHIRQDKIDVTVFWFVRCGCITVSDAAGRHIIKQGECAITRSTKPFYMELAADESGVLENMHVVVPSHLLHTIVGDNVEVGRAFPTSQGELFLTERILSLLFEEDDHVDAEIAAQLVRTLLSGLGRTIDRLTGAGTPRLSIAEKRMSEITRYINQNFSNPDLNAKLVATSCGISVRYLCYLLKERGLSLSSLIWEKRIVTAWQWLKDERMRHYSICEIAYLVGFKSSAHFSRMFKKHYGQAPRQFRNSAQIAA